MDRPTLQSRNLTTRSVAIADCADTDRHTASYGMSGPAMLNVPRIHEVNVGGTQNVVDCAAELGVAVIYTSS